MAAVNGGLTPSTETALLDKSARKLERRKRFEAVWPLIRDELVDYLEQEKMPGEAVEWFKRVIIPSYFCDLLALVSDMDNRKKRISTTTLRVVSL
jgi:hypothetical protein